MAAKMYIGCSGYSYNEWKELFYPADLSKNQWLSWYAKSFNTVELNSTFYRLPEKSTVRQWYSQTPDDFVFSIKGSNYTTHRKKLKHDDALKASVDKVYDTAVLLKEKLGCILWQLPGNLHRNDDKLESFCSLLVNDVHNCIEFRHESWLHEEVFHILKKYNTGFCIVSSPDKTLQKVKSTADFTYFRFHGEKPGKWYDYFYSNAQLKAWSNLLKNSGTDTVYAYFNNDIKAQAPQNALMLKELLKI